MKELLSLFRTGIQNRNEHEIGPWWAEKNPYVFTLADVTSAEVLFIDYVRGVYEPTLCLTFRDGTQGYTRIGGK